MEYYMLVNGKIVGTDDVIEWGRWFENIENRIVEQTEIDGVRVSTIFLGIDHSFNFGKRKALLCETMVFGGDHDDYQERYATLGEAKQRHAAIVDAIRKGLPVESKE